MTVQDSGVIVNPVTATGQVEGAVAQQLGYALTEEMPFDVTGRPIMRDLRDYHIFTADEMPEIVTEFIQTVEPTHPFGVKAVGEVPMDGVAPGHRERHLRRCRRAAQPDPGHAGTRLARDERAVKKPGFSTHRCITYA